MLKLVSSKKYENLIKKLRHLELENEKLRFNYASQEKIIAVILNDLNRLTISVEHMSKKPDENPRVKALIEKLEKMVK
jgi:hypothetical protein